ncbi:kelch repeat-containing protein [Gemmatimonadota bacterium]
MTRLTLHQCHRRVLLGLVLMCAICSIPQLARAQDTTPPQWIAATGSAGDTTITFWFDEPVDSTAAVTTTNFTLTLGLSIAWIRAIGSNSGSWSSGASMSYNHRGSAIGVMNDSIYVAAGEGDDPRLEVYDPATDTWTEKARPPTRVEPAAWGVIDGKFYLAGGDYNGTLKDSLYIYDPATDSWSTGTGMQVARRWSAGGVIDGKLYVVGGTSAFQGFENTLEIYDPGSDSWSYGSSMPTARERPVGGPINGKLYVAGGNGSQGNLAILEVYDPVSDSWTELSSMPSQRSQATGAVMHDQFYMIGGDNGGILDSVVAYDPYTDQWSMVDPTPTARYKSSAIGFQSKIYNLGGDDGSSWRNILEIYDIPTQVFRMGLGAGEVLPNSATAVTLTASNITDLSSNPIPAPLDTSFSPSTGGDPSINLSSPGDVQAGDVRIPFQISDSENNPVSLLAEYSTDESAWIAATVTGSTTDIFASGYQDSLTWHSGADLSDQMMSVWFKLTPRDNAVSAGTADSVSFSIDNKPPEWISATGSAGDTVITFWFDELVDSAAATNTSNITLSGGLTIEQIGNGGKPLDQWSVLDNPIPITRRGAFGGVVDDRFYVIGGDTTGPTIDRVDIYDPLTDIWSTGAPMPTPRWSGASAIFNGKIYVIGGFLSGGTFSSILEIYDPASDSWGSGTPMPTPRQAMVATEINGLIYVVAGENALGWVSALEIYDPGTDSWTNGAPKPRESTSGGAVALNGKMYVFGGHDGPPNNYLEVYDPKTDVWTALAAMSVNRQSPAGSVWEGEIYVTGGGDSEIWNTTEIYSPVTNAWRNGPSFSIGRGFHLSGIIQGSLYITAGGGPSSTMEELPFLPRRYVLELADGNVLPNGNTAVSLSASNIFDRFGNAIAVLDTVFLPSTGSIPILSLSGPSGEVGGDVSIVFQITDTENNPISLSPLFSTDGNSWSSATTIGPTTDITHTSYQDTLIWQSGTDLPGQEFDQIWFKITPSDNASTSGVPDSISFRLDNKPPEWIAATGTAGDTVVSVRFDELVDESYATSASSYSLSSPLSVDRIITSSTQGTWNLSASLPARLHGTTTTAIDGILYIAGGFDHDAGVVTSAHYSYDPSDGTWTSLAPMTNARKMPASAEIDGILYVLGGTNSVHTNSLEAYDPALNTWTSKAPMPTARGDLVAGSIDGKIYVVGGDPGGGYSSRLEIYDSLSNSWTTGASMPYSIGYSAGGALGGKLYVAGGDWSGDSVPAVDFLLEYDPVHDTWLSRSPMSTPRAGAAASVIGGQLIVAGGFDNTGQPIDTVEAYDPLSDSWSSLPAMPTSRYSICGSSIHGTMYVLGGLDSNDNPSTDVESLEVFPDQYHLILGSGQTLPFAQITLQATGISDLYGNVAATLDTVFTPSTGNAPSVTLTGVSGTGSGNVSIPFQISDAENNPVSLTAGFSSDGGLSWQSATLTGTITDIPYSSFQDTLIWQSGTDLPGQAFDQVWFKITPSDNAIISGVPDSISFGLDNKPPAWIAATGVAGDTTITFWFDELVDETIATTTTNISLSGGLSLVSISTIGTDSWATATSMPTARRGAVAAAISGKLYVAGGDDSGYISLSTLEVYDPATDSWITLTSMPTPRHVASAAAIDGKFYVVGGQNGSSTFSTLEVYDPATDSWTTLTSMPTARWCASAAAIGGKLYVVGGSDSPPYLSTLEVYDPATDSWTTLTSMPTARYAASAVAIGGKLYVVGGTDAYDNFLSTLEVYDPATDSWTTATSMPTARYFQSAVAIGSKLYVVGGADNSSSLSTLEVYDPATDSWNTKASMPAARDHLAAAAINDELYVVGGFDGGSWLSTLEVYTALPSRFELTLASGQILPPADTPVTLTASNISDLYGNTAAGLDTTFNPTTGDIPSISLSPLGGTQSGDISIPFQISDTENNPVSLTAGFSSDGGLSWQSATFTGTTTDIPSSSYQDTLIWQSRTDLPDRAFDQVWFKVTPSDNATTPGVPDSISFGLDNKPPEWIAASGSAGDTTITFWFDELVEESSATNPTNITLSNDLTVDAINISGASAGEWSTVAPLPTPRKSPSIGLIAGKIYVVGGEEVGGTTYSGLECYDPATNSWETRTSMPTARKSAASAVVDEKLYVIGGNNEGPLNTVEVYDSSHDSWATLTPMPTERWGCIAGVINGKIYVAGDQSGGNNTFEVYDPTQDSWTSASPIPTPRADGSSAVVDGILYVISGYGSWYENVLEAYDPTTDTWERKADIPEARQFSTAAAINGQIYVFGGNNNNEVMQVDVYDPYTDTWFTPTSLPEYRGNSAACATSGKIYLFGEGGGNPETVDVLTVNPDRFSITLGSGQELPHELITLQAAGIQDLYGNEAGTLSVDFVPNDDNDNPTISLDAISSEVSGDVAISYTISDNEGDPCDLSPAYSIDGGSTWVAVTTSSDTIDIDSASYDGTLIWQSKSDLPNFELEDVRFRISVIDNAIEIGVSDEITFHLDNNDIPAVTISEAALAVSDTSWTFLYTLDDAESDTLSLTAEYSVDDGNIWEYASVIGDTSSITSNAYSDSLKWMAGSDLPDATQEVLFRITPHDRDQGVSDTETVYVNSLGVPTVDITSDLSGELSGDITIAYTADDINGDPLNLVFEYEYPVDTWNNATVTGSVSLAGPSEYSNSLIWHSGTDLPGLDVAGLNFRITPSDTENSGLSEDVTLHVDNNVSPSVSLTSPSGTLGRDIQISCVLSDSEDDTLAIEGWWSANKGVSWQTMTLDGTYSGLLPAQYSQSVLWNSFIDCGYGEIDTVLVKLVPIDHDPGAEAVSGYFTVANYVGDYTGDVLVDFSDFATLVTAWNDQDTYHDIGPATGSIPTLTPVSDGVIDFEDLTVYLQMWSWSAENLPSSSAQAAPSLSRPANAQEAQTHTSGTDRQYPIVLEQPEPDDLFAPDDGILDLNLNTRDVAGLTSAGVIIHYDTRHLKFLNLQPGTFLGRAGGKDQNLLSVKRVDEELGRIEVMYGRIDSESPEVSGSGQLASIQFEKLSRENSMVDIQYDLRDRRAEIISSAQYQTDVTAIRIPTDFALLQNYPNPFNGETIIRFQLPAEQRVQLYIYNIRGQRVATIVDERMEAGYHRVTWQGRNDDGQRVGSGIYIYLIQAGPNRQSKKLTYIK